MDNYYVTVEEHNTYRVSAKDPEDAKSFMTRDDIDATDYKEIDSQMIQVISVEKEQI